MTWKTTSLNLECQFTREEKEQLSDKLTEALMRKSEKEDKLKSVSAQLKADITALQGEVNSLTLKHRNGYEYRDVECAVYYHSPSQGFKRIVRQDTYQTVNVERMDSWELQQNLFEEVQTVSTPEPPRPPAVENSADPTGTTPEAEPVENQDQQEPVLEDVDHVGLPDAPTAEEPVVPEGYEPEPEQPPPPPTRSRRGRS